MLTAEQQQQLAAMVQQHGPWQVVEGLAVELGCMAGLAENALWRGKVPAAVGQATVQVAQARQLGNAAHALSQVLPGEPSAWPA